MNADTVRWTRALVCACVVVTCGTNWSAQQPAQTPPVFRSGTITVPIDVRVLDKDGRPIAGLTQADFTIKEDNVAQAIRHFSTVTLTPAEDARGLAMATPGGALAAQNRRVILVVLGRGKLQPVSKGVDALIGMVKDRLLPQDRVAVFAFNRATDFTSDHGYIASVLDRFRSQHESIEAQLRQGDADATVYGMTTVARPIQSTIDDIFNVPGGPALRTPPAGAITDARRIAQDERDAREGLISATIAAARAEMAADASAPGVVSVQDAGQQRQLEAGFGGFVAHFPQSFQDLTSLYQGIEYLRHVDGEKHLIFVTERGMFLPRLEDDTNVAAMAADARVAIDVIQTGGLPPAQPGQTFGFDAAFVGRALRDLSALTGGTASVYDYASKAVDRIITATTSGYLLGYTPTNTAWDGRYRRISVQVNRRDATVLYRHGYYGHQPLEQPDWRQTLAYRRIVAAANLPGDVSDIIVTFDTQEATDRGSQALAVKLRIDPARIGWTREGTDWVGDLDVAIFCADRDRQLVGETRERVNLRLPDAVMTRARTAGLTVETRVRVDAAPAQLKVVVYNYANDLVGTASGRIVR
jgi:VWFA-related protein